MKLTIKSYRAVAEWKWDLPEGADITCGICRVDFEGTCSKCKFPGDDCPIVLGQCTHCYHVHCISDWLQSDASQGRCPLCRQIFREKVATPEPPTTTTNKPPTPSTGPASRQPDRRPDAGASAGSARTR